MRAVSYGLGGCSVGRLPGGAAARLFGWAMPQKHGDDHRLNTAAVEGAGLDNKDWPPESGFGGTRFGESSPPDLAALDVARRGYQESLSRDRSWPRCKAGSSFAGRRE